MIRVLLINPKFTEEVPIFNIPVSLFYLGSWLTQKGFKVKIIDCLHPPHHSLLDSLLVGEMYKSDMIGLTVMSTQVPDALRITNLLKRHSERKPIVWGGIHPTLYPEQTAAHPEIDYVVKGEGEYSFSELLSGSTNSKILSSSNPLDIDELKSLDWSLLKDLEPGMKYSELGSKTEFGASILTSRGCPHKCSFCINSVLGVKYRRRDLELVIKDVEKAVSLGIARFVFEDEDFFADKERVLRFLDLIEERKLYIKWSASVRTSYFHSNYLLNEPLLKRIKKLGCFFLGAGAESGSQRILDKINKKASTEDTLSMAKALGKVGIGSNYSFMVGLPGETVEDMKLTLNLIKKIKEVNPQAYILGPQVYRPYPGSLLFKECLKAGMKEPESLIEWKDSPYIHSEFASKKAYNRKLYPWVSYQGNLHSLVFYATLLGIRPRNKLVSGVMQAIGKWRCKHFFFKFPILRLVYDWIRGSWLEKKLRRSKLI